MSRVNTVMGPIPVEELGIVAIHEHMGYRMTGVEPGTKCRRPPEQRYVEVVPMLRQFREYGGETFVDATGIRDGRDVDYYKLLSARTGVLIVASTGFDGGHTVPQFFAQASADYLARYFIHEITIGIDHTDTRAGLIMVGASRRARMTELDERIHRAAARAALTTGVPVVAHLAIDAGPAIGIFHEEGLPLDRVLFGRTDNHVRSNDASVRNARDTWIAEQGGRVGFDTLGHDSPGHETKPGDPRFYARSRNECLDRLLRFIRAGHLDKTLASTHANRGPLDAPGLTGHTVNHIFTDLIPDLRSAGLDQATITTLLVDNPADFLAINS